jgi:hypothetical protein
MPNTYLDQTGLNSRKAIPTSRIGTRNLVWYTFYVDYDLLNGEEADGFTPYNASNSLYHSIVEAIQEAGELFHLGAPSPFATDGFIFAIADNDEREPDSGQYFRVGFSGEGDVDLTKSSVYQALTQRLNGENGWDLYPCYDAGYGIISL